MITRQRNNQIFVLASLFVVLVFFVCAGGWILSQQEQQAADAQVEAAAVTWSKGAVDDGEDYAYPKILVDSGGVLRLAATKDSTNHIEFGSCDTANDCTDDTNWTFHEVISENSSAEGLAIDSTGNIYIAYKPWTASSRFVSIARCLIATGCDETGDWTTYAITPSIENGNTPELVIDAADNLHIVYTQDGGSSERDLVYGVCLAASACDAPGDWTYFTVHDVDASEFLGTGTQRILVDSNNNPQIIYNANFGAGLQSIWHAYCNTMSTTDCDEVGDWSFYQIISDQTNAITGIGFDRESSNNLSVSYTESGATKDIMFIRCLSGTGCNEIGDWSTPYSIDTGNSSSQTIDLRISTDTIVTSYVINTPGAFHLASECLLSSGCDAPGDWTINTLTSGNVGTFGDLTVDDSGNFYLAYQATSTMELAARSNPFLVSSITPTQNAIDVSASSNISIVFSNSLTTGTVNQTNLPIFGSGSLLAGAYTFSTTSVSNDTVTFNPTSDFALGEEIEVIVTSNVQSAGAIAVTPFVSEFIVEATAGVGSFFARQDISASTPIVTGSADLDNDGDIDVVSVGGTAVSVSLNSGSGSFGAATNTTVLSNARSLTLADFNADGFIDIAVNHFGAASFSVLLNNGSGAFPTKTDYASGGVGIGIASGDLNGDGDIDLIIANTGSTSITTFANNGSGVFSSDQTLATANANPLHIAVGDMDNDGDLDVFTVDADPSVNVFANNGAGVFTRTNLTTTASPHDVEAVDINADGDLDLVVSTYLGVVSTFIGNGDGTFATKVDLSVGDAEGLAFGDVDNDNDIDFFSVDNSGADLDIILNNGSGILSLGNTYTIGSNPSGVSVGDYNADGALDFAATGTNDGEINIFFADASPSITLLQPNGGETIAPGSTYTIQWMGQDDSGGIASINLEFDNGGGFAAIPGATGLTTHAFNYPYKQELGSTGVGDGQWSGGPYFSDIDASGNIYGPDSTLARINKFDSDGNWLGCLDNTASGFVTSGCATGSGSGDGQFSFPRGVAIDDSGNIFVAEHGNNRIQKFDSDGNYLLKWGSAGSGNGQFNVIQDIEVDSSGNVYVMDRDNRRIQKFSNTGVYLTQWGSDGTGDGQFSIGNQYIAVDSSDNIWAAGQNRVQKFSNTGTFLGCLDSSGLGLKVSGCLVSSGSASGQFTSPQDVFVDTSGNIFVVDSGNDRIQKFDSSGNFILQWQASGSGTGEFNFPYAIDGRPNGNIIIGDPNNEKFIEYSSKGEFVWTVPASETVSGQIRITASDGVTMATQDTSDAVFTIGAEEGSSSQKQQAVQQQQQSQESSQQEQQESTQEEATEEETSIPPIEPIQEPEEGEEQGGAPVEEDSKQEENPADTDENLSEEEQEAAPIAPNEEVPPLPPTQEETETIEPIIRDLILQTPGITSRPQPPVAEILEEPEFALEVEFAPVDSGLNYQGSTELVNSVVSVTINKQVTKLITTDEQGNWMSFVSAAELGLEPGQAKEIIFDLVAARGAVNSNRVQKIVNLYLAKDGKTVMELVSLDDIPEEPFLSTLELIAIGVAATMLSGIGLSLDKMIRRKRESENLASGN